MKNREELAVLLEAFFTDWLVNQKSASPHTIASYKYTFQLLLRYAASQLKRRPCELRLSDLKADLIAQFLSSLVKTRKTSPQTRNIRLSAIKSFFHYVSFREPGKNAFISRVLSIPESRRIKKEVHYLTAEEQSALLMCQDLERWVGRRDHTLILVALETGLRLAELVSLQWKDVYLTGNGGYVQCTGKGRKKRNTPISSSTAKLLRRWKSEIEAMPSLFVFPNNSGAEMSSDCFQKQLKKYARLAARHCVSLVGKKVTPHILRHTAAMNFLQAGVDISTIAIILGHESIKVTQAYLEANLQLKEAALNKLTPRSPKLKRFKAGDKLLKFLMSLGN